MPEALGVKINRPLTVREFSQLTGFTRYSIYRALQAGRLKYIVIPGGCYQARYRIPVSELKRCLHGGLK